MRGRGRFVVVVALFAGAAGAVSTGHVVVPRVEATPAALQWGDAGSGAFAAPTGLDPVPAGPLQSAVPLSLMRRTPVVRWPGPGQVALTFDDGPHPTTTWQVLDVLAREQVPATFFVDCFRFGAAGFATRRAALEGQRIQNHTFNHVWLTALTSAQVVAELDSCSVAINSWIGGRPTAFRPPYGATSPRVETLAGWLGMFEVMWNATPSTMIFTPDYLVNVLTSQVMAHKQAGAGVVILLHDGTGSRDATVAALPRVIAMLRANGFQFVEIG